MTAMVLAEFAQVARMVAAARSAARRHYRVLDSFTPYPVEEMADLLPSRAGRIRVAMFIGGIATAAAMFGLEYYSAVISYPYNSGGRPLDSWPAFMLVPFATGILAASICGVAAFLVSTGLPRLHHPLFTVAGFERATQDRFVLALASPEGDDAKRDIAAWLRDAGASTVREVEA
jgi:hypothetical protein